jgi:hypothetical protein
MELKRAGSQIDPLNSAPEPGREANCEREWLHSRPSLSIGAADCEIVMNCGRAGAGSR